MRFETHIIAADADELAEVGEAANPLEQWSAIEAPGVDTFKLATLHGLLTGDTLQTALERYEPAYLGDNDAIVLRIADEVVDKLAAFGDDALRDVAIELAASEDFEKEHWPVDAVAGLLGELAELAQLAESQGQALFARIAVHHD